MRPISLTRTDNKSQTRPGFPSQVIEPRGPSTSKSVIDAVLLTTTTKDDMSGSRK